MKPMRKVQLKLKLMMMDKVQLQLQLKLNLMMMEKVQLQLQLKLKLMMMMRKVSALGRESDEGRESDAAHDEVSTLGRERATALGREEVALGRPALVFPEV